MRCTRITQRFHGCTSNPTSTIERVGGKRNAEGAKNEFSTLPFAILSERLHDIVDALDGRGQIGFVDVARLGK